MKKILIAGGTGFLGSCLSAHFLKKGYEVTILTRGKSRIHQQINYVHWDGQTLGEWVNSLNGVDVLINLNGKSVDCRYTKKNKQLIYDTRLQSTDVLGQAMVTCEQPPRVWINAASATIYRHSEDKEMDEYTGEIGTGFSVDVCQKWEAEFFKHEIPGVRQIAIRTGIVLGRSGGPYIPLKRLAQLGAGGHQGNGRQYVSWIHETDFVQIVEFLMDHPEAEGIYNVTAPRPVPNREFMKRMRRSVGMPVGIPMPEWLLTLGAWIIRTEPELILKSRRVVPRKLEEEGYDFVYPEVDKALMALEQTID